MPLTFLVGGARSGKSALAVRLADAWPGSVTFVATAEARDPEMAARIDAHRVGRPSGWTTVEAPLGLADALARTDAAACTVVDCLTIWVSNAMGAGATDDAIVAESAEIASVLAGRPAPSIVVSNEVGSGIVPTNDLARRYRDVLGRVNATVAAIADTSHLVVAGRSLQLETLA